MKGYAVIVASALLYCVPHVLARDLAKNVLLMHELTKRHHHHHHKPKPKPKPKPNHKPKPTSNHRPKPNIQIIEANAKKKMTILLIMAADNNLEPYVKHNIAQLEKHGTDKEINILLYVCSHRQGQQKIAEKAIIYKNHTKIVETIANVDSGIPSTLISACKWAHSPEFTAEHFCCILWDHGYGPFNRTARKGICYDNSTGHFLADYDLRQAFMTVCKEYRGGKPIDLIAFDACLMGSFEIAYAIQPYAHYMVASEETIRAFGMPYHFILNRFAKSNQKNGYDLGHYMVTSYNDYYTTLIPDYTLAFIDLHNLDALKQNLLEISRYLTSLISKQVNNSAIRVIKDAIANTPRFEEESFIDIGCWYTHLFNSVHTVKCKSSSDSNQSILHLKHLLTTGLQIVEKCIVKCVKGPVFDRPTRKATGLYIYLPTRYIERSYLTCHFARNTEWTKFLENLCKKPS